MERDGMFLVCSAGVLFPFFYLPFPVATPGVAGVEYLLYNYLYTQAPRSVGRVRLVASGEGKWYLCCMWHSEG